MTLPKYTKIKSKKDIVKIFPKDFLPIFKKDKIIQLYFYGIKKSENSHNDNFPKLMRFFSMMQIVSHVLKNSRVYDFVECGCWKGHSSYLISKLIFDSKKKVSFHIFDSFEGLSKSTIEDSLYHRKSPNDKKRISNFFRSNENFVKNHVLKSFNFVKTYKGWIPSRFYEVKNKKFSFIHIDVDLYKPTIESLNFFYPRVVDGGIIVCDDYNVTGFPGAKKAWDDFFRNKKIKFFFQNPLGGCFIIK